MATAAEKVQPSVETIDSHMGKQFAVDSNETQIVMVTPTKKDTEIIVTSISRYLGDVSLDTRRYYLSDSTEKWHPTSQGCKVPAKFVKQYLALLQQRAGILERLASA